MEKTRLEACRVGGGRQNIACSESVMLRLPWYWVGSTRVAAIDAQRDHVSGCQL
jgi:hypothetical protein